MLVIILNGTITKVVNEIKVKTNDTIITQLPSPSSRIIHAERSVKIYSFLKVAVCHMIILDKLRERFGPSRMITHPVNSTAYQLEMNSLLRFNLVIC